jgi:AcrR family transcriptional regulator
MCVMARKRNSETEAKIAEAATTLFCTQGYVDTTMAAIAAEAGVAVQTLYLRHGSKAAVLSAALDVAIAGDAKPVALGARTGDFVVRTLEEPDAGRALALWAHGARCICDRTHRLYEVIRSASADPDVAEVLDKSRTDRATGHRALADALTAKQGYDPAVPVQRAADLLYALGTEDAYLLFVVDRGWDVDEWERWVVDTVSAQILLPG